jgi:methyltransferase (TIGR00027 family)
MAEKSVEQKPSETAVFAALHRAIANKTYKNQRLGPDFLAQHFLPPHFRFFIKLKKIRENAKYKIGEAFPGLHEYMICRTAYFDRVFRDALKDNFPQIVVLGAGYDTRAYRYAELNQGTKIFELDIGPTQDRKLQCLKKARIAIPGAVSLVPINFNKESLQVVLEGAGYDAGRKTLFLWEGVTYYLEADAVAETLGFVSQFGVEGNAIAFDYTAAVTEENVDDYGVKAFYDSMKEHHGEEALMFAIKDGEIENYLAERELEMVEHLDNEEIERVFLLGEDGELIGRMTGHFRFVVASPKRQ